MTYNIRLAKITGLKTGKEWYKDMVGNYYAIYSTPFADNDPFFGGSYLTYSGIGSGASARIFKENLEILTEPFLSSELEAKQKEMGIDIKIDYSKNTKNPQ